MYKYYLRCLPWCYRVVCPVRPIVGAPHDICGAGKQACTGLGKDACLKGVGAWMSTQTCAQTLQLLKAYAQIYGAEQGQQAHQSAGTAANAQKRQQKPPVSSLEPLTTCVQMSKGRVRSH